ncbi:glycosyltransferase family 2 protein [Nesterenkonia jeotgali]|uniref:Glycosyltransferase 2-like domain-containing protein n=1 Tax=Nesterenkonia jeotgali TaxID=317018 RepID=A0A839FPJ2_9MICC|nr:glycosyltransferase family 2 protein [Nesterenkonia jeotgali]MBA8920551.1 hypothetical protein [Nesterenkonia jeotgali]
MNILPDRLLAEHFADAQRLGPAAEDAALLAQSPSMRQIFAYGASAGAMDWEEIRARVLDQDFRDLDPVWLAKLARVCGLQDLLKGDVEFALTALRHANRSLPKSQEFRRFHLLEIELLMEQREFEEAQVLLNRNLVLRRATQGYIGCDLKNPFLRADSNLYETWIEAFNRPLVRSRWSPVQVTEGSSVPFDRLSGDPHLEPCGIEERSPLVTVIMTTYRPERTTLLSAVNSILAQTWRRLELIIVDDASPSEFQGILDEVEMLDDRIRVHRQSRNGGTYTARNVGMKLARGSLFTGQDSDDWSHPERLQAQVGYLAENPDAPGVITSSQRMDEELVMTWRGRDPRRPCEVSLMVRREVVDRVGDYMPARKAADSEYRLRISAASSTPVGRLKVPLYFVRLLPNSLSRGDFVPGWAHPSRLGFRRAYTTWHAGASVEELHVAPGTPVDQLRVPIPARLQLAPPDPRKVDVAYVADWRGEEGVQRSALDELEQLAAAGLRVGVVHIDSWKFSQGKMGPFTPALQDGIMDRKWSLLRLDERAEVDLVVVRDPRALQFLPQEQCGLSIRRLMVLTDEDPADGEFRGYDVLSCGENARQVFGVEPEWAAMRAGLPVLEDVRRLGGQIIERSFPHVMAEAYWRDRPSRTHRVRPVVGRHARSLNDAWPEDPTTIARLWPLGGDADVWFRGSATEAFEVLDVSETPRAWVVFAPHHLSAGDFLSALDFYVTTSAGSTLREVREILEAVASGCIVIVPEAYRPLLGNAAIYASPDQVPERVSALWSSPLTMHRQRRIAADSIRHGLVANAEFVELFQSFLSDEKSLNKSGEFIAGDV